MWTKTKRRGVVENGDKGKELALSYAISNEQDNADELKNGLAVESYSILYCGYSTLLI